MGCQPERQKPIKGQQDEREIGTPQVLGTWNCMPVCWQWTETWASTIKSLGGLRAKNRTRASGRARGAVHKIPGLEKLDLPYKETRLMPELKISMGSDWFRKMSHDPQARSEWKLHQHDVTLLIKPAGSLYFSHKALSKGTDSKSQELQTWFPSPILAAMFFPLPNLCHAK
jgi:hypothetical protein